MTHIFFYNFYLALVWFRIFLHSLGPIMCFIFNISMFLIFILYNVYYLVIFLLYQCVHIFTLSRWGSYCWLVFRFSYLLLFIWNPLNVRTVVEGRERNEIMFSDRVDLPPLHVLCITTTRDPPYRSNSPPPAPPPPPPLSWPPLRLFRE